VPLVIIKKLKILGLEGGLSVYSLNY
jgi:hypothetical protein